MELIIKNYEVHCERVIDATKVHKTFHIMFIITGFLSDLHLCDADDERLQLRTNRHVEYCALLIAMMVSLNFVVVVVVVEEVEDGVVVVEVVDENDALDRV